MISSGGHGGRRRGTPGVFTLKGVARLATILNSTPPALVTLLDRLAVPAALPLPAKDA